MWTPAASACARTTPVYHHVQTSEGRIGEIGCLNFEAPTDVSPLQVVSSNSDKGRCVNFGAFALQAAESRSETDFLAQVYLIATLREVSCRVLSVILYGMRYVICRA